MFPYWKSFIFQGIAKRIIAKENKSSKFLYKWYHNCHSCSINFNGQYFPYEAAAEIDFLWKSQMKYWTNNTSVRVASFCFVYLLQVKSKDLFINSFSYLGFLSRSLTTHRTAGERKEPPLFLCTTSTQLWTLKYLLAVKHQRYLPGNFNHNAYNYRTDTRSYLSTSGK